VFQKRESRKDFSPLDRDFSPCSSAVKDKVFLVFRQMYVTTVREGGCSGYRGKSKRVKCQLSGEFADEMTPSHGRLKEADGERSHR